MQQWHRYGARRPLLPGVATIRHGLASVRKKDEIGLSAAPAGAVTGEQALELEKPVIG